MSKFTWVVMRKELIDAFRDKKSVITGMILPLIMFPVIFWFMGRGVANLEADITQNTTIAIASVEHNTPQVRDFLNNTVFAMAEGGITVVESNNPYDQLLDGDLSLILYIEDVEALLNGERANFRFVYNNTRTASQASLGFVQSIIFSYNEVVVAMALQAQGIDLMELQPIILDDAERWNVSIAADGQDVEGAGEFLEMQVPMMVIMMLSMGAMAFAIDSFAGEKERKTLEPLLTTRAGRGSILTGKFLAISFLGFLTTALTLVGLFLGMHLNADTMGAEGQGVGGLLNLPVNAMLMCLLLVLALQFSFTALHSIFSTWSKNIKEASSYGTGVMLLGMLPAFGTMFLSAGDVTTWMMFVPILNVAAALKMLLGGIFDYTMGLLAVGSSAVFLIVLLTITTRMFKKEEVLLRM